MYPAICKVSSRRGCVCLQMCTYACIYAHREAIGLVLENGNEEWTISSQLIGFAFPFFLLPFCSSKTISLLARIPSMVIPCGQHSGLMLQSIFEHSALSICCVLAVCPYGAVSHGFRLLPARLGLQLTTCRLQGF